MLRTRSLVPLRASLLAAMGLSLGACGGDVAVNEPSGGQAGAGGASTGTGSSGGNPRGTC
jgi:hypothetical protein